MSVSADDELAQTWDEAMLGATLDKADRILAAARELDRKLIADTFTEAQRSTFQDRIEPVDGFWGVPEDEYARLRAALSDAKFQLQEETRGRIVAERELATLRLALREEREKVKKLQTTAEEERHKLLLELSHREVLEARCKELEALHVQATDERRAAEERLLANKEHSTVQAVNSAQSAAEYYAKDFSELELLAGRLEQTLAELAEHGQSLSLSS